MAEQGEGNPEIEKLEQQTLGTSTYQKAEVVHKFADENPWFHPLLIVIALAVVGGIVWLVMRRRPENQ